MLLHDQMKFGQKCWLSIAVIALAANGLLTLAFSSAPTALLDGQAAKPGASMVELSVNPAQSSLHYTVDSSLHTVHGTFAIKSGKFELVANQNQLTGEIKVDASSGDSGNQSRDNKMHKEVLESSRYGEATFRAQTMDGKILAAGSSDVQLHGVLVLHGAEHVITVPVNVEVGSGRWKGTGKFEIPFVGWGMKDPSNFLLKLAKVVTIDVTLAGDTRETR